MKLPDMKIAIVTVSLALWPYSSASQDFILLHSEFNEELLTRSKVSTEIVIGVMLTGAGGEGRAPALAMAVPTSWKPAGDDPTVVCARVTSKNGLYTATNAYRISSGLSARMVPLQYPTEEGDFLTENESVVRITLGDCAGQARTFAAALWEAEARAKHLNVFLNAGGQPAAVASDGPGEFAANCIDESEGDALKYTARCEIPLANLNLEKATTLFFSVKRHRTVERFQIEVVVPAEQ